MSRTPLAVQVANALREAAVAGHVRTGERMPSSRALAARLGVSRTVTAAAYEQLHAEGWLEGRRGSGTYVSAAPHSVVRHVDSTQPAAEPTSVDLAPGAPCLAVLDPAAWRRAWRRASDRPALGHSERRAVPEFRAAITEHLLRHRGLGGPVDVLATTGTGVAAGELAAALFSPGDTVAVEEPGYLRAVGALRAAGIRTVPVAVDRHGLVVDAIPAAAKAVYCTPAHQFPLGYRMPAARRVALVEYARATGTLLIEDDYDGELRYDAAPLPLLAALAPDVVVHLGTSSKILTPTLGVGWLVAPPEIADAVVRHRISVGAHPSAAAQLVFAEFAAGGDLARHLRRVRRELAERRSIVVDHFRAQGITVQGDEAGGHVVLIWDDLGAETAAIEHARGRGIVLDGLGRHYWHVDDIAPHRDGNAAPQLRHHSHHSAPQSPHHGNGADHTAAPPPQHAPDTARQPRRGNERTFGIVLGYTAYERPVLERALRKLSL